MSFLTQTHPYEDTLTYKLHKHTHPHTHIHTHTHKYTHKTYTNTHTDNHITEMCVSDAHTIPHKHTTHLSLFRL